MHRFKRIMLGPYARATAVLIAITAGLVAIDRFLAQTESAEVEREAGREYRAGMAALAAGNGDAATVHLGRAHSMVRRNRAYQLALADALMSVGRFNMAEREIRDVLEQDSNDGEANLAMARLAARTSRPGDANAFYHRAIYGVWKTSAQDRRNAVRLELAEFLAAHNLRQELLSELLILQSDANGDPAVEEKVAGLLLVAGSPARATAAYRDILKSHPDDEQAMRGLAESELRSGDFRRAQLSFLNALRHKPDDVEIAKRLQFVATLSSMDPTPRRLTSDEKYRRSQALLSAVRDGVAACAQASPLPANLNALLTDAGQSLANPPTGRVTNEDAESLLSLAERIWTSRPDGCMAENGDNPATLLMAKIVRE